MYSIAPAIKLLNNRSYKSVKLNSPSFIPIYANLKRGGVFSFVLVSLNLITIYIIKQGG